MADRSLHKLSLDRVAAGCRDEAGRPRHDELGYCFELFRRALDEGDPGAWQAIAGQYHYLLLGWVHAASVGDQSAADEAAREALERFWRTLAGRPGPLAGRFAHTGALLKYLQQCALSTALDRRRRDGRRERLLGRLQAADSLAVAEPAPDEVAIERIERGEQLARVRAWVAGLDDPAERLVVQLSYVDGLSPAEIAAGHPGEFVDAAAVRQIKERVLRRARRALIDGGERP